MPSRPVSWIDCHLWCDSPCTFFTKIIGFHFRRIIELLHKVFSISSADDYYYGGFSNDNILTRMFSDGTVRWVLPLHLTTNCDVSIARFPYDSQSCYIDFVFLGLNGIDVVANVTREVMLIFYHICALGTLPFLPVTYLFLSRM